MAADNEYDAVCKDFVFEDTYRACALSRLAPTGVAAGNAGVAEDAFGTPFEGSAPYDEPSSPSRMTESLGSYAAYACSLCTDDKRYVFASRVDLWRDRLFEALLRWVNETLAPAVESHWR